MVKEKRVCRLCRGGTNYPILNMGDNALVNSLVEDPKGTEPVYPLEVVGCQKCNFVQVKKPIDAHKIYTEQDYLYYSSDMPGLSDYFLEYAKELQKYIEPTSFVVEIGSNDGIMLSHIAGFGNAVLGVDPSTNVAIRAMAKGIPTLPLFFNERNAKLVAKEMGQAKLIYANNCIAHIDDLDSVMEGVKALLTDDGVFVVECNYWGGMVKNKNYSLIYHDHFSYFSLKNWQDYATKFGLRPFDAVVTPAQGGSLRVFMDKGSHSITTRLNELMREEMDSKLNSKKVAQQYGEDCIKEAEKLRNTIEGLKKRGKTIAGYGAAAKGFSVLKLAGINEKHIDYFVDDSPAKQGKYTPVTHIPVISRAEAESKLPDYFFITAPNYAETIMMKEKDFKGKFVLCDSTVV